MPLFQAELMTVTVYMACRREYQLNKLQRMQNMCARNENKYCHITPLLVDLHWLPVKFRLNLKFW